MSFYSNNRSPPPLQHPVPTHPAYIPEPPATPVSPQGYQRYTSSPPVQQPYAQPIPSVSPSHGYAPHAAQYQPMTSPPRQQPIRGQQPHVDQGAPVDFSAWAFNDATANFGMQLGQSAVAAGQDYVQRNFGGLIPISALKGHFHVSNSYVLKKLRLLLFPWRHKPWARRTYRTENGQAEWQLPRDDINAPDLYIPLMALVTYILLVALHSGIHDHFDPEILGITASKALGIVALDFIVVNIGCYLLGIQSANQMWDLLAYNGYKFVGVIVTLLSGLRDIGRTAYILVSLYCFVSTAFFFLRSLRSVVLPDASATAAPVNTAQRSRRITFLFLVAVSQVFYMFILIRV